MAGEQLFSKFVIKGGGKTFTEQSTILIFRQKPIRLIVVNAAVIETYTVKKCTNRSRCAHGIYSLTMILKKNAKYRLFDFIQVKAKAGNTGIGIGLCHRKHLIHYGSESPCRIQNNSLNNFAKVICVFRVTHHEIVDGAVLQTELLRVCLDDFQNVLFLEIILGMQTGKLFVRDRNARAIFCIGFFAAQHPVKDVLPCTENRLIVHRISDNGSLTLKKLISTHYDRTEPTYKMEYEGGDDNNVEVGVKTPLEGNGDFRSKECLDLLDECDIVVTNPPWSMFREYVSLLVEHKKQFVIIGNKNSITYKEFFPLLKDNHVWIGYMSPSEFDTPSGMTKKVAGLGRWFTNLDIQKRHEKLILWQRYYDDDGNPLPDADERYPHYDNYDAINVDRVADIPVDYKGVMGVPITFLDKYNPKEFEILGYTGGLGWNSQNDVKTTKEYLECKQHNPDGSITSGGKVNTGAALCFSVIPAQRYYTASNCSGYLLRTYGRILVCKTQ